jgi:nicotinate-nucleotide adenylyltransferase
MRIGIFGGTFNPIHLGHLIASEEIRQQFDLQRIIFIPSAKPPHKPSPELIDVRHRTEMTRLAIQGNAYFDISTIEQKRSGLSYSVETVEALRIEWGNDADFFFILGIDAFSDIENWHEPQRLLGLCNFIVISRPGFSFEGIHHILSETFYIKVSKNNQKIPLPNEHHLYLTEVTPVGISSTQIRAFIRQGRSLKYLLPEPVKSYILSNGLYKEDAT